MGNKKGNPFKRGKTWTIIYYIVDENGIRKQKWKGGYATKEEAEEALKEYKAKVALGMITVKNTSNETLGHFLERWFKIHSMDIKPNTQNGYRNNIYKHIIPALGDIKLKNLKPLMIEEFYHDLADDTGLSAKSIIYIHNTLSVALKAAVDEELITSNPCTKVKKPKVEKYKPVNLTLEQIQRLMKAIEGHRFELEIKLAVYLGLRRGETLGIMESSVDFEHHTLAIEHQITCIRTDDNGKSYYGITTPKSESSERTLYIAPEIEELLKERIDRNRRNKAQHGEDYCDDGLINCNEDGSLISPQTLYHSFKSIARQLDFPEEMRFHDLRHSYAVLCIDQDISIYVLSKSLGHSSVRVTEDVYADSISAKRELSGIIAGAINGSKNN